MDKGEEGCPGPTRGPTMMDCHACYSVIIPSSMPDNEASPFCAALARNSAERGRSECGASILRRK